MSGRTEWQWSQPHEDYYCYELNPSTRQYDKIIWGRSQVSPPASRPTNPAPQHSSQQYPNQQYPNYGATPAAGYAAPTDTPHHTSVPSGSGFAYPSSQSSNTYVPSQVSTQYPAYTYSANAPAAGGGYGSSGSSAYTHNTTSTGIDIDPASDDEEMMGYEAHSRKTRGPEFRQYLENRFEEIQRPQRYFKKGRIFMMVWQEQGISPRSSFTKVRRFVVVRNRGTYCLCLCIHTYGGQATTKAGIKPDDHAPLVYDGGEIQLHPNEATLIKEKLVAVLEDSNISLSPYSRIDFGKVYTVNATSRVRTIGRIGTSYLTRLEEYFRAGIGVNEPDEADE